MSESLTDQVGGILKVRVTSIQKLDTGFSGGILKFQTLVSQWDTEKKCQFQTLYVCMYEGQSSAVVMYIRSLTLLEPSSVDCEP